MRVVDLSEVLDGSWAFNDGFAGIGSKEGSNARASLDALVAVDKNQQLITRAMAKVFFLVRLVIRNVPQSR